MSRLHPILAEVFLENRAAVVKRVVNRGDRWRIRQLDGIWFAWPIEPGVYVNLIQRHCWLHSWEFLPLLADVTRRIYHR